MSLTLRSYWHNAYQYRHDGLLYTVYLQSIVHSLQSFLFNPEKKMKKKGKEMKCKISIVRLYLLSEIRILVCPVLSRRLLKRKPEKKHQNTIVRCEISCEINTYWRTFQYQHGSLRNMGHCKYKIWDLIKYKSPWIAEERLRQSAFEQDVLHRGVKRERKARIVREEYLYEATVKLSYPSFPAPNMKVTTPWDMPQWEYIGYRRMDHQIFGWMNSTKSANGWMDGWIMSCNKSSHLKVYFQLCNV